MKAGTSVPRMRKASISTASVRPMPKSLMKVMLLVAKAMNTTAMSSAAAVTIRPVRSRPRATDSSLSPVRSYSSLMRERRNTS